MISEELRLYIQGEIKEAVDRHETKFSIYGAISFILFLFLQEEIIRFIITQGIN
jgi:hypothetical protein